jgi:REP element-mobilizing transposase RayT
MKEPRGRHSRGYLPHFELGNVPQFLTWRLKDAVPTNLIDFWKEEMEWSESEEQRRELARRIERYADLGYGECLLRDPRCGRIVQECLFHDHNRNYTLHHWAIMPNHVHVLLSPRNATISEIVRILKSVTSTKIGKLLGTAGGIWQADYFDRWIRNREHFVRTARYVEWNPKKAGLVDDPKLWLWSSANESAQARLKLCEAEGRGPSVPAPDAD